MRGRRAFHQAIGREPSAVEDTPLRDMLLPSGNRLPIRVEDEVTAVAKQLHPIVTGLEDVHEQRLADAMLAGAGFDGDAVFTQDRGSVSQVLRDTCRV